MESLRWGRLLSLLRPVLIVVWNKVKVMLATIVLES